MAWLHATPKPAPRARRGKHQQEQEQPARLSRIDELKKRKVEPRMPPNPAPHITEWLIELGITEAAAMSAAPVSWREIDAWQRQVCLSIEPWEKRLLRRLSAAYLAESRKAEREHCPPPWRTPISAREREVAEAELRSVLG